MLQSMKHRGPGLDRLRALRAAVRGLGHARQARRRQHAARLRVRRPAAAQQGGDRAPARRSSARPCTRSRTRRSTPSRRTSPTTATSRRSPTASRTCAAPRCSRSGTRSQIVKDLGDAESVVRPVQARPARRHARDRPRADGDRVRRRHLRRAPVLGVSVLRHRRRPQRAADELPLLEAAAWSARGHRFQSECDSEIIAVYLAEKMAEGTDLEGAMRQSSRTSTACSPTSA